MDRGRTPDRTRQQPTLTQRQRELLALYAAAPPGEPLTRFCRRAHINRDTWYTWRTTSPDFAAELARIRQERTQVALEPLQEAVPALVASLVELATGGSIAALRTAGDWLGLTRRATEGVQLALTAAPVVTPPEAQREPTQEEWLAEIQDPETARLRHIVYRYLPLDVEYLKRERAELDAAIRRREAGGPQFHDDLAASLPAVPDDTGPPAAAPDALGAP